jgi:hypothetical protein
MRRLHFASALLLGLIFAVSPAMSDHCLTDRQIRLMSQVFSKAKVEKARNECHNRRRAGRSCVKTQCAVFVLLCGNGTWDVGGNRCDVKNWEPCGACTL